MPRFLGFLALAAACFAFDARPSHAGSERPAVINDDYHYFVHAGNCSRSIRLVRACTCPDEAELIAQEYRDKNYRLVWIKTTPETY